MPRRYLGFGHGRLNPEKVSEKAKLFMRAKTRVDKNPSIAVTEVLNLTQPGPFKVLISVAITEVLNLTQPRPFKVLVSVAMLLQQ